MGRAYVTVHGEDKSGIVYHIPNLLAKYNVDILSTKENVVEGKILLNYFVDFAKADIGIQSLRKELIKKADEFDINVFVRAENTLKGKKKLIIFDVESTLVDGETLDELGKELGLEKEIADITRKGMEGKITFQESMRERLKLLKGTPFEKIEEVSKRMPLMPGAKKTIKRLKESSYKIGLASGGFTPLSERLKDDLGVDYTIANELIIDDGSIVGIKGKLVDGQSKLEFLRQTAKKEGIDNLNTVAVGDGANDIPMIEEAGVGIGFNPKDAVKKVADGIVKEKNLRSILYALGLD